MIPWLLLVLTAVFAYLTYDSLSLVAPTLPYSKVAKDLGQDLSYMSLAEQEKLNRYPNRYRLGDLNQIPWLFAILTIVFATASALAFLK